MLSLLMTLIFYGAGCIAVAGRCPDLPSRLLGIGALPAAWISLCGIAGLLNTLLGLPPLVVLIPANLLVVVAASKKRPTRPSWLQIKGLALATWPYLICMLCASIVAVQSHQLEPWGGWDSLFTWVLRARFFFVGGADWKNAFSNDLALLHPDYPPLLGWALHALWRVDGQMTSATTAILFSPFWLGYVFLVAGFQAISTERIRPTFSTAVVLAIPIVWKLAAIKLADFGLAYSILGCCAWYTYASAKSNHRAACLAGFFGAWSCLMKNEGLTWFAAFVLVIVGMRLLSRTAFSRTGWAHILRGAAVPIMAIGLFKLTLAPPSDLVQPMRSFEIGELVQPGILINPTPLVARFDQVEMLIYHRFIWGRLIQILTDWRDWAGALWWGLLLMVLRLRRPATASPLLLAVALQIVVYYTVYLITPYHPYWHLSTSLSRILAHVVPAGLCLLSYETPVISAVTSKNAKTAHPESACLVPNRPCAAIYLILASLGCVWSLQSGHWQLGEQPALRLGELQEIEFPGGKMASYVSSDLGIRDFYAAQFEAVPTVLVIDRREELLLARFAQETDLLRYCQIHHWKLEFHRGGFGWARDLGGKGLPQPVTVPRIQ